MIRHGLQLATAGLHAPKPHTPEIDDALAEALISLQVIDEDTLLQAKQTANDTKINLSEALSANNLVPPDGLLKAKAKAYGTSWMDLDTFPPDPRLPDLVDPMDCLRLGFVPWRLQGSVLVLAITDPSLLPAVQRKLPPKTGSIRHVLIAEDDLHRYIHKTHGSSLIGGAETRAALSDSCRDWSTGKLQKWAAGLAAILVAFTIWKPALVLTLLFALAVITLCVNCCLKAACLVATRLGRREPEDISNLGDDDMPKISILVPLFKEQDIASSLVERLSRLTYPKHLLEICLVVEADDHVTRAALKDQALPSWMRLIVVPGGGLKTKPRAMNYALDFTTGSLIGVYDAEDAPDPDQLQKVVQKFRNSGPDLACVQGVLSYYNATKNWMSRCFFFEYAAWFRIMLPGLERLGFAIPLGGTTLFFRRDRLIEMGAWDAHNVTEDADLGMRLARHGYRCAVLDTVTLEEANSHIWPWIKQRSRWIKGYAITWCVHMRDPARLLQDLGPWKFIGFQILFLGSLAAVVLAPFLWLSLLVFTLQALNPTLSQIAHTHIYGLAPLFLVAEILTLSVHLVAAYPLKNRPALGWVLALPVYFTFGTIAAYKGLTELLFKPFYWDKTAHGMFGGQEIPSHPPAKPATVQ